MPSVRACCSRQYDKRRCRKRREGPPGRIAFCLQDRKRERPLPEHSEDAPRRICYVESVHAKRNHEEMAQAARERHAGRRRTIP